MRPSQGISTERTRDEPLLVGQSLELWRGPQYDALVRRDPSPLIMQAHKQLDAGAAAVDVNFGSALVAAAAVWAARELRKALPETSLWLDCSNAESLKAALPAAGHPIVANAAFLGADANVVLAASASCGGGVVLSPAPADRDPGRARDAGALLSLLREGAELADHLGVRGPIYADCLAHPPAVDGSRCRRSLVLTRKLAGSGERPLVAVGNVGHGASPKLRPWVRRLYAAAATGAGAAALILPVEDSALVRSVAIAVGGVSPADGAEWWLADVGRASSVGDPLPSPPPGVAAGWEDAHALLTGTDLMR